MKDVKLTEEYIEEMIFNGVWRVHEGITTVKKEAKYLTKKMLEVRKLLIESHLPQVSSCELLTSDAETVREYIKNNTDNMDTYNQKKKALCKKIAKRLK